MDDFVGETGSALIGQGLSFARELVKELRTRGSFVIILSSDGAVSCSIRFHRARPGESWLVDDLESYELEGILVLETNE